MKVGVTFFHTLEASRNVEISLPNGFTIGDLLERLIEMYGPNFQKGIRGQDRKLFVAIMLNGVSAGLETRLKDGDNVSIVSPIAGG